MHSTSSSPTSEGALKDLNLLMTKHIQILVSLRSPSSSSVAKANASSLKARVTAGTHGMVENEQD